jgi:hypothetical protein
MYSKQVSQEKALKLMYKLQFFIMIKKCTFCIMSWLVKINSKLKKRKKFNDIDILELLVLDTKLYELFKNRLRIYYNYIGRSN